MAKRQDNLFKRLTQIFKSGTPQIQRKIRTLDTGIIAKDKSKSSGTLLFQKSISPTYNTITSNAYNLSERLMRYNDYQAMEQTPEIAQALTIWADETVAVDDKGRALHIFSDNDKIKEKLDELFYNNLNIEFNLRHWARNLVKYGDIFIYLDVSPESGIINAIPIPVNEMEREENYDRDDPFAFRFRWTSLGNRTLENWEIAHFRLLGNDMFLPYGASVIDSARRIWRQLILIEDAMLVYRVVRAPDRRVFYIDVGNLSPTDIPHYMEQQRQQLRMNQVIDNASNKVDMRYNPMCNSLKSLIKLQDGRCITLGELINEWNSGKQDQWVYSVDLEKKCLAPGKIVWAGITRKDAELVRVTIDDNTWYDCTPDHKFMLRDGLYKRADELNPGDALMPLYVKHTTKTDGHKITGYEKIYDPFSQNYITTHRNNVIETQGFDVIKGKVVHHKDFDKLNNNPSNLQAMSWGEHQKLHGDLIVERNKSLAGRKCSSKTMKKTWSEGKISSDTFVNLWNDNNVREKRVNKLKLNIGNEFIDHLFRILDKIHKGLSVREAELINALNEDNEFQTYIKELNPDFKNGFTGKVTRLGLQTRLKRLGYKKPLEELKREWLLSRFNINDIENFCINTSNCKSKDVVNKFRINMNSIAYLIEQNGYSYYEFIEKYLPGNKRYQTRNYKNHKVVSVKKLSYKEDTGCITVEKYHNFAAGPSIDCHNDFNENNNRILNSGIYLHNSVDEDYFIATRGTDTGTRIDTLSGGQNTGTVEDVAYIQSKLFSALGIPKAYLGYEDSLGSKASLSQQDIRFSRSVSVIQRTILAELNKIAIIHLYSIGFSAEEVTNFTLKLSNPSTVAQQQKLELWRSKFEIGGSLPDGMGSRNFVYKELWGLSDDQINKINIERVKETLADVSLANMAEGETPGSDRGPGGGGGPDLFSGAGDDLGDDIFDDDETGGDEGEDTDLDTEPGEENAGETPEEDEDPDVDLLLSSDDPLDKEKLPIFKSLNKVKNPSRVSPQISRMKHNRSRLRNHGASKTHMPDFNKMTNNLDDEDSVNNPFDKNFFRLLNKNDMVENINLENTAENKLTNDMKSMLSRMSKKMNINEKSRLMVENDQFEYVDQDDIVDIQDEIDESKFEID